MNNQKNSENAERENGQIERVVKTFYYGMCEVCENEGFLRRKYFLTNVYRGFGDWLCTLDLCLKCRTKNIYANTNREHNIEMCSWNEIDDWKEKQIIKSF